MDQWSLSQSTNRWAEGQRERLLLLRHPQRLRPWYSRSLQSCHMCHTMPLGKICVSHHCVCIYPFFLPLPEILLPALKMLLVVFLCAVSTRSVDMTITNIIEGRVKYTSIPTLHETTDRASVSSGANVSGGVSSSSSLFGGSRSRSVHLSLQRQMSLDERKKLLLEQSRK